MVAKLQLIKELLCISGEQRHSMKLFYSFRKLLDRFTHHFLPNDQNNFEKVGEKIFLWVIKHIILEIQTHDPKS